MLNQPLTQREVVGEMNTFSLSDTFVKIALVIINEPLQCLYRKLTANLRIPLNEIDASVL